jgi:formate dehydrogenase subunit gamma
MHKTTYMVESSAATERTHPAMTTAMQLAVDAAAKAERDRPGALLPVLHRVQDQLGYVPAAALPAIAKALNLSRAEVHGVVGFYPHFRDTPRGRHLIHICCAEACQARGSARLVAHAKDVLGIELHATTADGQFTLEPVYCLGNCACSPAMMLDDDLHGRVDDHHFDAIIGELKATA